MPYVYRHFIPQNIAPKSATSVVVYDENGKKVCSISLGTLAPKQETKLYSFGLISDTHLCPEAANGATVAARLETALFWFEQQGAAFVTHCGDITNVGFENPKGTYSPAQFAQYQQIRNNHPNLPIYAAAGNHESYNANVINYEEEYKTYTGHDIRFTVEYQNDIFIFLGQPTATTLYVDGSVLPVPELAWLETQLNNNKDKRCFVFIHPYMTGDSGDTLGMNPNDLLPVGYVSNTIKNALINHGKAILFHGHSHFMPAMQELDKLTNYTDKNGFPSVHVSSLGWAAYIENGEYVKDPAEGIGYLVDVYKDCIVINGRDFARNQPTPHGTLKINVEEGEDGK